MPFPTWDESGNYSSRSPLCIHFKTWGCPLAPSYHAVSVNSTSVPLDQKHGGAELDLRSRACVL